MNWKSLPLPARQYVAVVILTGVLILGTALVAWPPHFDSALAVAMLLAGALGSQKITLAGRPGPGRSRTHLMSTISVGFPVVLGSLVYFGPPEGVLVAFASALGATLYPRRQPFFRGAFTTANLGLTALASGYAMEAVARREGALSPEATVLPLLAGTLIYYVLNAGMVAVVVALSQGKGAPRSGPENAAFQTRPDDVV